MYINNTIKEVSFKVSIKTNFLKSKEHSNNNSEKVEVLISDSETKEEYADHLATVLSDLYEKAILQAADYFRDASTKALLTVMEDIKEKCRTDADKATFGEVYIYDHSGDACSNVGHAKERIPKEVKEGLIKNRTIL